MKNSGLTRELLELKVKVMTQKIERLSLICNILFGDIEDKKEKYLKMIKEQYLQICQKMIKTGHYEKYRALEDIVVKKVAKIELNIEQYIFDTARNYKEIINKKMQAIVNSESYQNFNNLDQIIQQVETLEQVFKLYRTYRSTKEIEKMQKEIIELKFEVLYRKQVEQLIYENGSDSSNLTRYCNQMEKEVFIRGLEQKVHSIKNACEVSTRSDEDNKKKIKEDYIFEMKIEQIMGDSKLLERLIIMDMITNPYYYINLLKAKIFNAHLCNIGDNPFEAENYLKKQYKSIVSRIRYDRTNNEEYKANRVNYSLLEAILKSMITDENVNIMECENLYKKFGFKCQLIFLNIGQKCVKIILDEAKKSSEFAFFFSKYEDEKNKKSKEEKYGVIDLKGLVYEFNEKEDSEDLLNQVLEQREVELIRKNTKQSHFFKRQEIQKAKTPLQKRKERVREEGSITTDREVIMLLIEDIKEKNKENPKILKEVEKDLQWLENLKGRKGKLAFEEIIKFLFLINRVYEKLNIDRKRRIIPLEYMQSEEIQKNGSRQVQLVKIPKMQGTYSYIFSHSMYGSKYGQSTYTIWDTNTLWKKYQEEFKKLEIDVKKCSQYYKDKPIFEIAISLDDIADLPIDYEKVKILTKEELQKILEREEEEEKE